MSLISLQEDTKPTNNCSHASRAGPQWPHDVRSATFSPWWCPPLSPACLFYRCSSKTWAEAKAQSQPSTSCPLIFCGSTPPTTPGESKRSQRNTTLPGTASTTGQHDAALCMYALDQKLKCLITAQLLHYSGCASINHVSQHLTH